MLELIKIQFKGGEMFLLRSCSTWLTKMSATENNRTDGSQINLNEHEQAKNKSWVKYKKMLRCLDSWVVSHLALNISLLHHALDHDQDTIYVFFMIVVGFLIWYSYLSVTFVMWIVKQEIKNKQNLFLKKFKVSAFSREHLVKEKLNLYLITRHQCERGLWYVGKPTVGPLTS